MTSSRMSPSVVPGSVRQSISIVASPGMTLYLMPAWMTSGLMRVPEQGPQGAGVHLVAERAHGGVACGAGRRRRSTWRGRRHRAAARPPARPAGAASTGVSARLAGDGQAADRLGGHDGGVVVAGHGAVAPRAVDGDPVRPRSPSRPPGSGRTACPASSIETPPASLRAPAARSVSGPVRHEPPRAVGAAGLLVGAAREQHVAAEAGDGVRAPGPGRRRGRGGRGGPRPSSPSRPSPSCRPPRDPRRSRRRRRPRTERASSSAGSAGTTSRCESRRSGVAAGAVAAEADGDRAAARARAR